MCLGKEVRASLQTEFTDNRRVTIPLTSSNTFRTGESSKSQGCARHALTLLSNGLIATERRRIIAEEQPRGGVA